MKNKEEKKNNNKNKKEKEKKGSVARSWLQSGSVYEYP
jgi:hypothetical protein